MGGLHRIFLAVLSMERLAGSDAMDLEEGNISWCWCPCTCISMPGGWVGRTALIIVEMGRGRLGRTGRQQIDVTASKAEHFHLLGLFFVEVEHVGRANAGLVVREMRGRNEWKPCVHGFSAATSRRNTSKYVRRFSAFASPRAFSLAARRDFTAECVLAERLMTLWCPVGWRNTRNVSKSCHQMWAVVIVSRRWKCSLWDHLETGPGVYVYPCDGGGAGAKLIAFRPRVVLGSNRAANRKGRLQTPVARQGQDWRTVCSSRRSTAAFHDLLGVASTFS